MYARSAATASVILAAFEAATAGYDGDVIVFYLVLMARTSPGQANRLDEHQARREEQYSLKVQRSSQRQSALLIMWRAAHGC